MKFKQGDTVYLKATIDNIKNRSICINLGDGAGYNYCEEHNLYTKEEMLAELAKPEMPKVGYVYSEPPYHKTNAKVVFMNEKDVVVEDDSKLLRVVSIKTIQENFKRVSYDQ